MIVCKSSKKTPGTNVNSEVSLSGHGADALRAEQGSGTENEKHDAGRGSADWPAYLRMLDHIDPSYRT